MPLIIYSESATGVGRERGRGRDMGRGRERVRRIERERKRGGCHNGWLAFEKGHSLC